VAGLQKIGLNVLFLQPGMGGMEAYVRNLLPNLVELRPDVSFVVFADDWLRADFRDEPWAESTEFPTHPLLGRKYTRALTEVTLVGRLADSREIDLLHSLGMTAPLRTAATNVVTVPDLIWLHLPESLSRMTTSLWRLIVPPIARRADRVITFSRASRDDIVRDLRVPESRVDVVPPGHGVGVVSDATPEAELRSRFELGDGPIVLTASHKRPNKNLLRLIRAMKSVCEGHPTAMLVLPGHSTRHEAALRQEAQRLGVSPSVRFLDWLSAADLEGLYRCSSCFVYPSLKEGFGLPVLEAMRRGLPVACSQASSLPEVGGEAALYFDPTDPGQIAGAVERLLTERELATRLVNAGRMRSEMFTWRATAEGTIAAYERAHEMRR
jgi:glycosyltransferase involved in cell wall biosynthesis